MDGKRALAGLGLALALVTTSACGKAAEKVAEEATEKALEDAGGGDVEIDADSGEVKIDSKDGSISVDDEGNMSITDENGESTFTTGEDAELPEGWPKDVGIPKGVTITMSSSSAGSDGDSYFVTGTSKDSVQDLYDAFKSDLEDAGFEITADSMTKSSSGDFGTLSAENDEVQVSATVGAGAGTDEGTLLSVNVSPNPA